MDEAFFNILGGLVAVIVGGWLFGFFRPGNVGTVTRAPYAEDDEEVECPDSPDGSHSWFERDRTTRQKFIFSQEYVPVVIWRCTYCHEKRELDEDEGYPI